MWLLFWRDNQRLIGTSLKDGPLPLPCRSSLPASGWGRGRCLEWGRDQGHLPATLTSTLSAAQHMLDGSLELRPGKLRPFWS